jgi:hypothetical protein
MGQETDRRECDLPSQTAYLLLALARGMPLASETSPAVFGPSASAWRTFARV